MTTTTTFCREVGESTANFQESVVRANLSACVDHDDDERRFADEVEIEHITDADGQVIEVIGRLNRAPEAAYLDENYDPAEAES